MPTRLSFRLTGKGRAKLNRAYKIARASARFSFKEGCEKIVKPNVSKQAPTLDEERRLISVGVISESYKGRAATTRSGLAGDSDDRRFKKGVGQHPVKEAILMEPVEIKREREMAKVYLGKTTLYNPGKNPLFSIGFSWHGGGQERSTDDSGAGAVWKHLLESWEYGGVTFTVRPRTTKYLEPERWAPGRGHVLAKSMIKTIPQFGMFLKGGQVSREPLRKLIESKVKSAVRGTFS